MEELVFRTKVETGSSVKDTEKLKKSVDDVGKSVDNLGKETTKEFKSMKAALDSALQSTGGFEDKMKALDKVIDEVPASLKDLNKQVQAYQTLALQAGRESPIGREALLKSANLKDKLVDLQNETKRLADDQKNLKGVIEIGSTVVAGYGALNGAMALTGVKSEELQQALVKLQAVQTILLSLDQLKTALQKESNAMLLIASTRTKVLTVAQTVYTAVVGTTTGAMKALKIAMLAIPIIAIIAGIMALVSALAWFFSSAEKAEEMNNKVNASFERQDKILEANGRAFKRNADNKRKLMESELATAEELYTFDRKRVLDEEKNRKKSVSLLKDTIPKKREAYMQALEEENYELAKTIKDEISQMRDKYTNFIEQDGQYAVDLKVMANKRRNELAKEAEEEKKEQERINQDRIAKSKEYADKRRQAREEEAKKKLEEERLLEDLLIKNIQDEDARRLAELRLRHQRELEELILKYGKEHEIVSQATTSQETERLALMEDIRKEEERIKDEQAQKDRDAQKAANDLQRLDEKSMLEGKLIQMQEDFEITQQLKAELALIEMEQALERENITEGEKFKIRQEYAQKIDAINEENINKEKERQSQLAQVTEKVLTMSLTAAQDLSDAFFDYRLSKAEKGSAEELRIEKKKFEVNKKLQVAQAIMQGIQAVQAAYSSGSAIPIVGAVTGPAFAALAGITSALNVAKIANAKFDGGTSASSISSSSTPSVSVPSVQGQAPDSVSTLTQGLPGSGQQSNTTKVTLLQSELEESLNDSAKVSVVSNVG